MTYMQFEHDNFLDDDFPMITSIEEEKIQEEALPEEIGILTLKNTVLYPGVVIPITVGRDKSIQLVRETYKSTDRRIGVVAQKNIEIEDPSTEDLYRVGTIARILKMIKMPDGSVTIVIQAMMQSLNDNGNTSIQI